MFCRIVVTLFVSSIFSPFGLAQGIVGYAAELSVGQGGPQLQNASHPRRREASDDRISVVRLRVPQKAQKLYNKALTAIRRHQSSEAQQSLNRALGIEPQFPEALALHGFIQATSRQWASAEQSLQAALQSDPGYAPAYVVLAGVYNTQSRFDDAQRAAQQAVALGLTTWPVQYEITRAFIGKQQYEQALAVAETALRFDHGPLIHLAKAHALLGLHRYAPALDELRVFLHYEPSGDGSHEAHDLLQQITAIVPNNSDGE
jgi:tetratricopeptide (TPR) repeat protein